MALVNTQGSVKNTFVTTTTTNQNIGQQGTGNIGLSGTSASFGAKVVAGNNYELGENATVVTTDPEAFSTIAAISNSAQQTNIRALELVQSASDKYADLAHEAVVSAATTVQNATPTNAAEVITATKKVDPLLIGLIVLGGLALIFVPKLVKP